MNPVNTPRGTGINECREVTWWLVSILAVLCTLAGAGIVFGQPAEPSPTQPVVDVRVTLEPVIVRMDEAQEARIKGDVQATLTPTLTQIYERLTRSEELIDALGDNEASQNKLLNELLTRIAALEGDEPEQEQPEEPPLPGPGAGGVPVFRGVNMPAYSFLVEQQGGQWHPKLIETLRNFSTIRFLDWEKINNNSSIKKWSDVPTAANWKDCIPVKDAMSLCNAVGAEPYLQLHFWAADNEDYVRRKAREIKKYLPAGRKVRIAVGNEVWNGSFSQFDELYARSRKDKRPDLWAGTNDNYRPMWRLFAEMQVNAFRWLREELGDRVICVAETKATTDAVTEWTLGWKGCGEAADELAIAPYFKSAGVVDLLSKPSVTFDAGFWQKVRADVATAMAKTEWHKKVADKYGLDLIYYEFGPHYVVSKSNKDAVRNLGLMTMRPEMEDICKEAAEGAVRRGVKRILWYQLAYPIASDGYAWGLFDKDLAKPTPKWTGYSSVRN